MPEKLDEVKALFLCEVSKFCWNLSATCSMSDVYQLQHYYKEPVTSTQQHPPHNSDIFGDSGNTWVNDVLGLNFAADQLHSQTLTAEVQAYLLDLQRGTNSIMFWQVHLILSILIQKTHSHTYNYRKISFNTLPSLPLLWIFCPFRAQLCLARGFSLLPRRPCQLTATVSCQNWWRLCRCWNSWFQRVGV